MLSGLVPSPLPKQVMAFHARSFALGLSGLSPWEKSGDTPQRYFPREEVLTISCIPLTRTKIFDMH
jgi:hypothetical protein